MAEAGNRDGFALKSERNALLYLLRTTTTSFLAAFKHNNKSYNTITTKGHDRIDPAHALEGISRWQSENSNGIKMTPSRRTRSSREARRRRAGDQQVRHHSDERMGREGNGADYGIFA